MRIGSYGFKEKIEKFLRANVVKKHQKQILEQMEYLFENTKQDLVVPGYFSTLGVGFTVDMQADCLTEIGYSPVVWNEFISTKPPENEPMLVSYKLSEHDVEQGIKLFWRKGKWYKPDGKVWEAPWNEYEMVKNIRFRSWDYQ